MGSGSSVYEDNYSINAFSFDEKDELTDKTSNTRYSKLFKATLVEHGRMAMDRVTRIPKVVAIKIFDKELMNEDELETTIQSIKNALSFRHTHTVMYYEYFENRTSIYVVMEYVPGESLLNKMENRKQLSERQSRIIFQQLLLVAVALEEEGLMHSNIHSAHILFADNKSLRIKLINLDALTVIQKKNPSSNSLSIGRNSKRSLSTLFDPQVDLFAIGVLLFYMLSGTFPFQSEIPLINRSEIMKSVLHNSLNFHDRSWLTISDDAKLMIEKILSMDLGHRITPHELFLSYDFSRYCGEPMI